MRKSAAVYIRVSDPKQEKEGTSLTSQEELLRKYCREQGYILDDKHVYIDVHTGTEFRERPQLTVMRQAAKRGEFEILIMYALDRFARKRIHQEIVREELQHHGVTIATLNKEEHADDDSPIGEIVRAVYGFMAEEERNKIIERTQLGLLTRVKSGKLLAGNRPLYGYKYADPERKQKTHYIIDPDEGLVVQRVYQMALDGMSLRRIGLQLAEEGVPTPSGKDNLAGWSPQAIKNILNNPFYTGKASAYKSKQEVVTVRTDEGMVKRKKHVQLPEEQHIKLPDGVVPPLIDDITFEKIQIQLQLNKQNSVRNNKHPEIALLRCGMIKCKCGHNLAVDHSRGGGANRKKLASRYRCPRAKQGYARCNNSGGIRVELIDAIAWEHAIAVIKDPALIIKKVQEQKEEDPTQLDAQSVKGRLIKIQEELKGYSESLGLAENKTVRALIIQQMERLAKEQEELEIMSHDIRIEQVVWSEIQKEIGRFDKWCKEIRHKLDDSECEITMEEKRNACRKLGMMAYVWRENGEVKYEISCNPSSIASMSPPNPCIPT